MKYFYTIFGQWQGTSVRLRRLFTVNIIYFAHFRTVWNGNFSTKIERVDIQRQVPIRSKIVTDNTMREQENAFKYL
jgi:hypothetical protein